MNSISGWAINYPGVNFEAVFASGVRLFQYNDAQSGFQWKRAKQETWHVVSLNEQLGVLSRLADDWDGYGAAAIEPRAIYHARMLLPHLQIPPDCLLPSVAGTVLVEWEGMLGRASLELGGDNFGFYTSPSAGDPILLGGPMPELDVGEIDFAVATVAGKIVPQSMEGGNWHGRL
jgi:hypothetical protein